MTGTSLAIVILVGIVCTAMAVAGWRLRTTLLRLKRESRKLRAAAAKAQMLGVLFERSDDALLVCDTSGRVVEASPSAIRLLDLPSDKVIGVCATQWVKPVDAHGPSAEDGRFPIPGGEADIRGRSAGTAVRARVSVHKAPAGKERRVIVRIRDLTEQHRTRRALKKLARFDSLTGLPNRQQFRERLDQAMERARRGGRPMALFFLDLDRFKIINDSLGHAAGDSLLKRVAEVLTNCLRGGDSVLLGSRKDGATLSRLGGDEFTVILEGVGGPEEAAVVAQRLLDMLTVPFEVSGQEVQISASIGISMYPAEAVDLEGLIRRTDMAMYRSKALGRNTYSFFSDDLNAVVSARLAMEASLRQALDRQEFLLHYQPKADLRDRRITGVEALLRWHCPGRGTVSPDRFISVLEETGLIVQAGAWAIREACRQLAAWDAQGLPPINMAVNLSARQLRQPFLVALVRDTLVETGVEPARLELELTESMLMEDTEGNRAILAAFHKIGVRLAIDDFGTGHSSLSYLRRLEVDTLKIDRSFVIQLPDDGEDAAIAAAIIAMGKSLNMKIVAEGVETEAQAEFLKDQGCNDLQGWLLSRALPAETFAGWLQDRHREYLARTQPRRYQSQETIELPNIRIPDAPPAKGTVPLPQAAAA